MEYRNFDIHIRKAENSLYAIEVTNTPSGGKALGDHALKKPFDIDEVEFSNLLALLKARYAEPDEGKQMGKILHDWIFDGSVQALYLHNTENMKDGERLRIRLQVDPPELSNLPWEYCFRGHNFLALGEHKISWARYIPGLSDEGTITARPPVRILLAAAIPPDLPEVQADQEIKNVQHALRKLADQVEVRELRKTHLGNLYNEISNWRPHILHFIGHGLLKSGQGALVLSDGKHLDSEQMTSVLGGSSVKVAVLNACNTAAHGEHVDSMMGVAQALIGVGIPAVVAMQFKVPDEIAVKFAAGLYDALANGRPLDEAVTAMRVLSFAGQADKIYWAIPVLYMRAENGVIWQDWSKQQELLAKPASISIFQTASGPLRDYLEMIINRHRDLPLPTLNTKEGRPSVPLEEVFVDLDAGEGINITADPNGQILEREVYQSALGHIYHNHQLILLGEAGKGTTTLLSFLAFCLANELLFPEKSWRSKLSWPIKVFHEGADKPVNRIKRWPDAPVIPILVELSEFSRQESSTYSLKTLWRFIGKDLAALGLSEVVDILQDRAKRGEVFFLFHGMDKVRPEATAALWDFIQDMARSVYGRNRWVVTSRVYAFQNQELQGIPVRTLERLTEEKITTLARNLHQAILRKKLLDNDWLRQNPDWVQEGTEGSAWLQKLTDDPRLKFLAENPMFLTFLVLRQTDVSDPQQLYARLYEDCVAFLLESWQPHQDTESGESSLNEVLKELALNREDLEKMLWEIAWVAHAKTNAKNGEADGIQASEVMAIATRHFDGDWLRAAKFMKYTERGAHVLTAPLGIGVFGGEYTFRHPDFQEYLAACHLAHSPRLQRKISELGQEGETWKEILKLVAARVAIIEEDPALIIDAVDYMLPTRKPIKRDVAGWWQIFLAAEMIAVVGRDVTERDDFGRALLSRLCNYLAALLREAVFEPPKRALVGDLLGALGDPRPGIHDLKPKMISFDDWAISQYPITNAQFRHFVEDNGYSSQNRDCWSKDGWAYRTQKKLKEPRFWQNALLAKENRPVVGVSWFEAEAYVNWLSRKTHRRFQLPGIEQYEQIVQPMGERWPEGVLKLDEVGVSQITAVGCFPEISVAGIDDIYSNLWEWCQTAYEESFDIGDGEEETELLQVTYYWLNFLNPEVYSGNAPDSRYPYLGFRITEQA